MAPNQKHFYYLGDQAQAPIKNQDMLMNSLSNSESVFPILVISVLSIMGTAFLLLSYYFFLSKCCNSWHIVNLLRQFPVLRARQIEEPFMAFSPALWNHGLDESITRDIPTFQFKREAEEVTIYSCVVCLNEFQEQDMLRALPNCSHAFHLDCIDIWFQSNANCPLCRTSISGTTRRAIDQIIAPRSSPQGSQQYSESLMGGDEDFVVIEFGGESEVFFSHSQQERDNSTDVLENPRSQSPKKLDRKLFKKPKKRHHVSIMGDECIDVRENDGQFCIQPIRRSFSLDSAADPQLGLTVQKIVQQNGHNREISNTEECSSRIHRSFFPLRQAGGSKNAVLPISFEFSC